MISKVTTRGQVSIPAVIRKKFHIEPESKLEWIIEGNVIKVVPLPRDVISAFRGRGRGKYTHEEFMRDRNRDRLGENTDDR